MPHKNLLVANIIIPAVFYTSHYKNSIDLLSQNNFLQFINSTTCTGQMYKVGDKW